MQNEMQRKRYERGIGEFWVLLVSKFLTRIQARGSAGLSLLASILNYRLHKLINYIVFYKNKILSHSILSFVLNDYVYAIILIN